MNPKPNEQVGYSHCAKRSCFQLKTQPWWTVSWRTWRGFMKSALAPAYKSGLWLRDSVRVLLVSLAVSDWTRESCRYDEKTIGWYWSLGWVLKMFRETMIAEVALCLLVCLLSSYGVWAVQRARGGCHWPASFILIKWIIYFVKFVFSLIDEEKMLLGFKLLLEKQNNK